MKHRARSIGAVVLTLGLSLCLALAFASSVSAAFPGQNGRIVFVRYGDRHSALYSVNPDGSGLKRITKATPFSQPKVNPQGRRIVFVRDTHGKSAIFTVSTSGHHLRRLTPFDISDDPAFSGPSGRRIAYTHPLGHVFSKIWVMASDGTNKRQLTHARVADGSPAFSPDGEWIAFERKSQIFKMKSDGSKVRRLSHSKNSGGPDYSPNGKSIIFGHLTHRGYGRVWIMRANGTHIRQLTQPPLTGDDDAPAFSPNGKRIVFVRQESGAANNVIYTMKRNGTHLRRVTPRSWNTASPNWAVARQ